MRVSLERHFAANAQAVRQIALRQYRSTPWLLLEELEQVAALGFCIGYGKWRRGAGATLRGWCLNAARFALAEYRECEARDWTRFPFLRDVETRSASAQLELRIDMARSSDLSEFDPAPKPGPKETTRWARSSWGLFSRWG